MATKKATDASVTSSLEELESIIEDHLASWEKTAKALARIRDERLWSEHHKSYGEYADARFGMAAETASRYANAGHVLNILMTAKATKFPANESQCRPLATLKDEKIIEVWKAIEATKKKITADLIQQHIPTSATKSKPRWVEAAKKNYEDFQKISNRRAEELEKYRETEPGDCIATFVRGSTLYCVASLDETYQMRQYELTDIGWDIYQTEPVESLEMILTTIAQVFADLVPQTEAELVTFEIKPLKIAG